MVFYYLHENTYPGELLGFLNDSGLGVFQGFFNRGRGGGHIEGILHGWHVDVLYLNNIFDFNDISAVHLHSIDYLGLLTFCLHNVGFITTIFKTRCFKVAQ